MLIAVDQLPSEGRGFYAHYFHRHLGGGEWRACDIRGIVRQHENAWLEDVDRWHQALSRAAAARSWLWWLLPASRLTAWYPVDLKPLLFALGIIEFLRSRPGQTLYAISLPDDTMRYLEEWRTSELSGGNVQIIDRRRRRWVDEVRRQAAAVRPGFIALRQLGSVIGRLLRGKSSAPRGRAGVVMWSHTLSASVMVQVGDHFFGRVFDDPATLRSAGVHWVYHLSLFRERNLIRQFCDSIGRRVSFEFEWLRWSDVLWILIEPIGLRRSLRILATHPPELVVGGLRTTRFPRRFMAVAALGYVPIFELAVYRCMTRCLREMQPAVVIYPYEEKGLERAILKACVESPSAVRTIAFSHAVCSKGHRYIRNQEDVGRPGPDVIATTGVSACRWFIEWGGLSEEQLRVFGSPRFVDPVPARLRRSADPVRVLFIVGYGTEVGLLASYVEARPDLFVDCDLMIRCYPHGWQAAQHAGLGRLRDLGVVFRLDDRDLDSQIAWSDVVLFCSTSAGIEAMLRGRIVIRAGLDDVVDADPTDGKGADHDVIRCQTADELKAAFVSCIRMDSSEYGRRVEGQRRFARGIYAPFDKHALTSEVLPAPTAKASALVYGG